MTAHVHEGLIEHASIDKALRLLIEAVDHPGTGNVGALLEDLAGRIRGHLAREDLHIAKFADVDAEDAKRLLEEHAGFRATLDVLSAHAKDGKLSNREVHEFRLRLSFHEAHEETGLYRWVKAG